jgi:hypothetical protein
MMEEKRKLQKVIVLGIFSDGYISTTTINHPVSVTTERIMINDPFENLARFVEETRLFTLRIDYHD